MDPLFKGSGSFIPNELHPFSKSLLGPEWLSESCCGQILRGSKRRKESEGKRKSPRRQFSSLEVPSLESLQLFLFTLFGKKFHLLARAYLEDCGEKNILRVYTATLNATGVLLMTKNAKSECRVGK